MMAPLASKGGQTPVTVSTAKQDISVFRRDRRSGFQWIHLEKQTTITTNKKLKRNSHGQQFNEWSPRGVYSLISSDVPCPFTAIQGYLLRQRRIHHATSKEYSKFLEKDFLTKLFLGYKFSSFTSLCSVWHSWDYMQN